MQRVRVTIRVTFPKRFDFESLVYFPLKLQLFRHITMHLEESRLGSGEAVIVLNGSQSHVNEAIARLEQQPGITGLQKEVDFPPHH